VTNSLVEHRRSLAGYEGVGMNGPDTFASFKQTLWAKNALGLDIFAVRGELEVGASKVDKSGSAIHMTPVGSTLEVGAGGASFQLYLGGKANAKLGSSREWEAAVALDLKVGWVIRVPLKKTKVAEEEEEAHASKWHSEATTVELGALARKVFLFSNRT
jgi:hypothetical protein